MQKFKVTFSKTITLYATSEDAALEGACGEVEDRLKESDVKVYLNAKVWTT